MSSSPELWPFEGRAFLGDTEKLTAAETGAYIRLLIFYWYNHGLPQEDAQLRHITGLEAPAWRRSRETLRALFRDGWRHVRIDNDLAALARLSVKKRRAAMTRWEKNTGDKKMTRESSTCIGQPQLFQPLNNFPTHAPAMLKKERIESLPLELEDSTLDVEKVQPSGLPQNGTDPRHRRALHAWDAALRRELGSPSYAQAIEVLANDMALVQRATLAEMRTPGSGITAVLIGLRGKLSGTTGELA